MYTTKKQEYRSASCDWILNPVWLPPQKIAQQPEKVTIVYNRWKMMRIPCRAQTVESCARARQT